MLNICNKIKDRKTYIFKLCTELNEKTYVAENGDRFNHLPHGMFFHEGFELDDEDLDYLYKKYSSKLEEEKITALIKAKESYEFEVDKIETNYSELKDEQNV
jgi:hypothetical protein